MRNFLLTLWYDTKRFFAGSRKVIVAVLAVLIIIVVCGIISTIKPSGRYFNSDVYGLSENYVNNSQAASNAITLIDKEIENLYSELEIAKTYNEITESDEQEFYKLINRYKTLKQAYLQSDKFNSTNYNEGAIALADIVNIQNASCAFTFVMSIFLSIIAAWALIAGARVVNHDVNTCAFTLYYSGNRTRPVYKRLLNLFLIFTAIMILAAITSCVIAIAIFGLPQEVTLFASPTYAFVTNFFGLMSLTIVDGIYIILSCLLFSSAMSMLMRSQAASIALSIVLYGLASSFFASTPAFGKSMLVLFSYPMYNFSTVGAVFTNLAALAAIFLGCSYAHTRKNLS